MVALKVNYPGGAQILMEEEEENEEEVWEAVTLDETKAGWGTL